MAFEGLCIDLARPAFSFLSAKSTLNSSEPLRLPGLSSSRLLTGGRRDLLVHVRWQSPSPGCEGDHTKRADPFLSRLLRRLFFTPINTHSDEYDLNCWTVFREREKREWQAGPCQQSCSKSLDRDRFAPAHLRLAAGEAPSSLETTLASVGSSKGPRADVTAECVSACDVH